MARVNALIPVEPADADEFHQALADGKAVVAQLEEAGAQYKVTQDEQGEFDLQLVKPAEAKPGQTNGFAGLKDLLSK